MRRIVLTLTAATLAAAGLLNAAKKPPAKPKKPAATKPAKKPYWVEPMKKVHARFKGEKGTFAHFGDSITVTMAFWSSLKYSHKNMDKDTQTAFDLTKGYMKDKCWTKWKGARFGNTGMMTIRWAHKNVDKWLETMKPEVVLIMFGTNDLHALRVDEYRQKTAEVVQKCLDKGTIVILSTIPPRHGIDAKAKTFVEAVRKIAKEKKVPLSDYYKAIMGRRLHDWDGALPKFKGTYEGGGYQVPTLVSADGVHPSNPKKWVGDYSAEGLTHNGFTLRNYVVLKSYYEVLTKVIKPKVGKPAVKAAK